VTDECFGMRAQEAWNAAQTRNSTFLLSLDQRERAVARLDPSRMTLPIRTCSHRVLRQCART
jgi:hypothetical protein